jgi:hypothetical protein
MVNGEWWLSAAQVKQQPPSSVTLNGYLPFTIHHSRRFTFPLVCEKDL